MIEINLLPESMRKEKKEWPKEILLFFIGGFLVGILILAWIFSSIQIIVVNGKLSRLEREWKELLPITEETSALMEKKQQIDGQIGPSYPVDQASQNGHVNVMSTGMHST